MVPRVALHSSTTPASSRSNLRAMSTNLRFGIIGSGMMGVEHIHNLNALDGVDVVAVADPDEGSRAWGIRDASPAGARGYADYREMLADDILDAVVVATPNMTHVDVMRDVLAYDGLHVLIEKPLATTVDGCKEIIAAADGRTGVVWMGLEYRYMPAVARLVAEVRQGTVGAPRMVSIREHRFPFLPKVKDWNRFNRNTGGTLVEKTCHHFDLMHVILRESPVRVAGFGGQDFNHLDERYDGQIPDIWDAAYVIVEFESGARAMLDLCMYAEASEHQEEIAVVGDRGKVEAFTPSIARYTYDRRQLVRVGARLRTTVQTEEVTDERIQYHGGHYGASFLELMLMRDAIRNATPPEVTLGDGLRSVAIAEAAQRAIREKRVVELSEVLG